MTSTTITRPKILCVDDDPNMLNALKRQLRQIFDVVTAGNGVEGLKALEEQGPFIIVISDMKMPQMDGAAFLTFVKDRYPDTIRILLAGEAGMNAAVKAVNQGQIFRFLTKPCVPQALHAALKAALIQHRLITAERELLEDTLRGSILALTDILALVLPEAFGRSTRVKRLLHELTQHMQLEECWYGEVAAMLAPIGYVTLPLEMVKKMYHGHALTAEEEDMLQRARELTGELLSNIPRLEAVRETLNDLDTPYSRSLRPQDPRRGDDILWGARALKVARHYDTECAQGLSPHEAIRTLTERTGAYDPSILDALRELYGVAEEKPATARMLAISDLEVGMELEADVTTDAGGLIVPAGQRITPVLLDRLRNYKKGAGVKEPIAVRVGPTTARSSHALRR